MISSFIHSKKHCFFSYNPGIIHFLVNGVSALLLCQHLIILCFYQFPASEFVPSLFTCLLSFSFNLLCLSVCVWVPPSCPVPQCGTWFGQDWRWSSIIYCVPLSKLVGYFCTWSLICGYLKKIFKSLYKVIILMQNYSSYLHILQASFLGWDFCIAVSVEVIIMLSGCFKMIFDT